MNEQKVTPKDFFLQLGASVALYVSAVSFLNLIFSVIDYAFPDNLDYYVDPYSSAVRWGIAMLVIFFPLFVWITSLIGRDFAANPAKRAIWVRKWLAYLTLFVAGLTIAVDLVVLLNSFLGGEITTRFIIKVISVLVVAGAVFWYYINDLRRDTGKAAVSGKAFAASASVLILASLIAGFAVMGSPANARQMRLDEQRVSDLANIQSQLVSYWQRTEKLPENLDALRDEISGYIPPTDPDTKDPYEYETTGNLSFILCASFSRESAKVHQNSPRYPYDAAAENWQHGTGRTCFDRTIDPELYPPYSKTNIPVPVKGI